MPRALVTAGINELSAHMFILCVGMLSYITPPIAMAAFPAAILAKTSAMKVAVSAARLGAGKYLLPFFFVLDPGLLLIGEPKAIVFSFFTTMFGTFILVPLVAAKFLRKDKDSEAVVTG